MFQVTTIRMLKRLVVEISSSYTWCTLASFEPEERWWNLSSRKRSNWNHKHSLKTCRHLVWHQPIVIEFSSINQHSNCTWRQQVSTWVRNWRLQVWSLKLIISAETLKAFRLKALESFRNKFEHSKACIGNPHLCLGFSKKARWSQWLSLSIWFELKWDMKFKYCQTYFSHTC